MKRLEEICIFIRNGLNIKNNKSKKGIPITRIETISNGIIDINKTGYANIFDDKYIDYYLRQDDILMSHINSLKHLGKVGYCYYDMKIIHGMNLLNIRVNPNNVYPKYLYYYFKSNNFKIKLNKISKQSVNQSSFSISDLKKIKIDIIDLKKQKLIASKLDKVVEVISIRKKQIEELNNLIKSQFVEMFGNKKYIKKCLKDLSITKGKYGSGSPAGEYQEGKPRYIRITDINEDGKLNDNITSPKNEENIEKYILKYGDVLFARTGATVGKTYKYSEKDGYCIYAGYCIKFSMNLELINPDYLFAFTKTEKYKMWVKNKQRVVAQPNINAEEYGRELMIPVPPITLQNEFSEIVKQIDKQKFEIEKSLKEIQELYESLMEKYFG